MNVYGYGRASTNKQEASCPRQKSDIEEFCRRHNLPLKEVYLDDNTSGMLVPFYQRPQALKLIEALEQGDTIVVWRLDRFGRKVIDALPVVDDLVKAGITIRALDQNGDTVAYETPADVFTTQVMLAAAEYQARQTSEACRAALRYRHRNRIPASPIRPLGFYILKEWGNAKRSNCQYTILGYRPHMGERASVRAAITLRRSGLTWKAVMDELHRQGHYQSDGKKWSIMRMRQAYFLYEQSLQRYGKEPWDISPAEYYDLNREWIDALRNRPRPKPIKPEQP